MHNQGNAIHPAGQTEQQIADEAALEAKFDADAHAARTTPAYSRPAPDDARTERLEHAARQVRDEIGRVKTVVGATTPTLDRWAMILTKALNG